MPVDDFLRPGGLASLTLGLVLGPVAALVNQQAIYSATMWACGHGMRWTLHVIPVLSLVVVAAMGAAAHRNWRTTGGGREDDAATVGARSRFLSILGMSVSAFSALVIVAQWLSIFVFNPCMRP